MGESDLLRKCFQKKTSKGVGVLARERRGEGILRGGWLQPDSSEFWNVSEPQRCWDLSRGAKQSSPTPKTHTPHTHIHPSTYLSSIYHLVYLIYHLSSIIYHLSIFYHLSSSIIYLSYLSSIYLIYLSVYLSICLSIYTSHWLRATRLGIPGALHSCRQSQLQEAEEVFWKKSQVQSSGGKSKGKQGRRVQRRPSQQAAQGSDDDCYICV